MDSLLWYAAPADSFTQALPIGNGSLGALVYGGVPSEKITLNLDTFWSGFPKPVRTIPAELLDKARSLILQGEYKKAEIFIEENMLNDYNESYLPLGTLTVQFLSLEKISGYKRQLDLETAVVSARFFSGNTRIQSDIFSSFPDNVMVLRVTSSTSGKLDVAFSLSSELPHSTVVKDTAFLFARENAPSHVAPNYVRDDDPVRYDPQKPGMAAVFGIGIRAIGGTVSACGAGLLVRGATEIELILAATDGYRGFGKTPENSFDVLLAQCLEKIKAAQNRGVTELLRRHLADYQALFRRMTFQLPGGEESALPTDERLRRIQNGREDTSFLALYTQYSRYLLIASSREGSQPANLQGIWNEKARPPWSCNWTININTQMNYWPADMCNLSECEEPLYRFVKELSISGTETAAKQYGCRGWCANHNADLWRQTTAVGGRAHYAYWPMGGVWLSLELYRHYCFKKSEQYLRGIFPILRGAARFCADWLVQGPDGKYYTLPSTSPENVFADSAGNACAAGIASTMDITLIKMLFSCVTRLYAEINESDDLLAEIKQKYSNLPEIPVGKDGRIQEWLCDFEETEPGHRHFSPLIGLHPGNLIHKDDTPALAEACARFLERRVQHGSGNTSWSCAWLISLYARLGRGNEAYRFLISLLRDYSSPNLFSIHPPLAGAIDEAIFQIDGNFGGAAGIIEMLVQSHDETITLLPALGDDLIEGAITGIVAEGGFEVDIYWKDGLLTKARIRSLYGGRVTVKYQYPKARNNEIILDMNREEERWVVT
jgi:alpha-L-fucosidase 2